jgi:hypothetical protein
VTRHGTLADTLAIRDLLYRYARGVDRRDLDLVRACFAPDCRYEGTLARGTIADMLAALPAAMARYERTLHFMGEPRVTLDGDAARSETPTLAYHMLREPAGTIRLVCVRYRDELGRLDGGWRITVRTVRRG